MALLDDLQRLGLPQKEAAVYLALLRSGTASVQAIAHLAGLVRPTAYVILQSLMKKGLVSKVQGPDVKKMLFTAEEPARLERYFEARQREIADLQRDLVRIIPELRSEYASGEEKPRVRLFEGKDGLERLQEEFVAAGDGPIVGFGADDELYALFPEKEFHERIRAIRLRAKIPSRVIYTTARGPRSTPEEDQMYFRESRYMPPEKFPIHGSQFANGPVISQVSHRNKIIGVLIEHQDIADSFRAVFEIVWEYAGAYKEAASMVRAAPADAVPAARARPAGAGV